MSPSSRSSQSPRAEIGVDAVSDPDAGADPGTDDPALWSVIAPVRREIRMAMALAVVGGIAWIASILLILPIARELTDDSPDTERLWWLVAAGLAAVLLAFLSRSFSFRASHLGAFRLEQLLRTELTDHLAEVPLGYVVTEGSGTLKKIVLDDVRSLHAFVADSTPLFARAIAAPLLGLVAMFVLDWRLALLSLAIVPLGMVAMFFAFRDYEDGRREVDAANERMNTIVNEYVQGMHVVRLFDDGSESYRRYRTALDETTRTLKEWNEKSQGGVYVARTLFAALPTVLILLAVGIPMYRSGRVDFPMLATFLALGPTVIESVLPLVWLQQPIVRASASVKRIERLRAVDRQPRPESGRAPVDGSVEFRDVSFRYDGRADDALSGVSITMEEGTVTALVGRSGAGKSTVAQLIPRFWDADAGAVLVGGVDVREMTPEQLMGSVSFVFQSPFLLDDTIAGNIRLGDPDATDAEVEAAARAAQAHEFIVTDLPDGYDSIVGERGSSLSGGQRQRITIARAILQDNPIIVLDEATAFADPDNEFKIHEALAELARGKTLVVVAHRLSTITDAHQIVVLDEGRVVECGRHTDLVAQEGRYARMWSQFHDAQEWRLRSARGDVLDEVGAEAST
ncbi:MAG: ABC transporter ATP-binding protein [Actinomycetota bacterium]